MKNNRFPITLAAFLAVGTVALSSASDTKDKPKISLMEKILRTTPFVPAIIGAGATAADLLLNVSPSDTAFHGTLLAMSLGILVAGRKSFQVLQQAWRYKNASQAEKEQRRNEMMISLKTAGYASAAALIGYLTFSVFAYAGELPFSALELLPCYPLALGSDLMALCGC